MLNPKNLRDGGRATVVMMANLKANRKVSCHEEAKESRSDVDNRDEAKSEDRQNHYDVNDDFVCDNDDDNDDNDDDEQEDGDNGDDECEW